jgi:SAM-dependent methyltransferase
MIRRLAGVVGRLMVTPSTTTAGLCFAPGRGMMPTEPRAHPGVQSWERAEIARSSVEAGLTPDSGLKVSARTLARYVAPPAATPYPLEYCYHLLGDVRGLRVVDFGCGSGANTVLLANRGAEVWGVDISQDLIRLARRRLVVNGRARGAQFVVGSAHDLPFPDGSVDVLFGIAILHHLDLAQVSGEVHRVLRPGGRAIFQEPVRNARAIRFLRSLVPYRAPDISPYERPLTDPELHAFASRFAAVRVRAFGLPHVALGQFLPVVRRQVDRLYRFDSALLRAVPSLAHYAGIRVMEVTKGSEHA